MYMCKKRFLEHRRSQLMLREDGPFQILKRINVNAYKVDLPDEYGVKATFNVFSYFFLFYIGDDLRSNSFFFLKG